MSKKSEEDAPKEVTAQYTWMERRLVETGGMGIEHYEYQIVTGSTPPPGSIPMPDGTPLCGWTPGSTYLPGAGPVGFD